MLRKCGLIFVPTWWAVRVAKVAEQTEFLFFDASEESCMSCSPNDGPSDFKFCMEFLELFFPFCGSLTGAHPDLLTNENKKALESC